MSASGTESTRVQLCGRLSVELRGVQRADGLRGRQVRLLLAYLLLNRSRHVGREELIGALWPEQAPASEDAALRTLLSRVRSALGASVLSGRDELILTLPEPVWVDLEAAATEVERAVEALERGDVRSAWGSAQVPLNIASRKLLPGSQAGWLEPPRRELEDIRLRALEVVGAAGLRMGGAQLASVERAARTLIESEPYRESGYVLLMESLAARGNVAEGMRVYERLRTLLREELGTTPSAEAIAVHDRLLHPELRPHRSEAAEARVAEIELPAELRARSEASLVGRHQELGELLRLWGQISGGGAEASQAPGWRAPRIVCLAGEAGIGKSRLAAELARRAHDGGAVVLAGRAPRQTLVPYQPFLEALRHYFTAAPLADVRAAVSEFGGELGRLVPELRRRVPDLPAAVSAEPETERYRLFEAVVGLLGAISARAPILLVLDDLQWADRPTLLLLRHLARAAEPARLLTLIAYRSEVPEGLGDVLMDLRRDGLIRQLEIAGLSERETAQLVRMRAGEAPSSVLARQLYAATEGNPFFIEEIVRHLVQAGVHVGDAPGSDLRRIGLPEGVKEMIALRLARLAPETVELLRVAAVIGRDFDPVLAEQLTQLDEEQFLRSLEEALDAGLLLEPTPNPGRYSFSHALIPEALYEGMSAERRARIHARVGGALERQPNAEVGELALHFTQAASRADAEKAIGYATTAGRQAAAVLAYEDAAEHYSRALQVLTRFQPGSLERRCELLLLVGEARVRAGERLAARAALIEAATLAIELGDSPRLARAVIGASRRYVQQPGVVDTELIALLERALELTEGDVTLDRVKLLSRLTGALYYAPDRSRMVELSAEAAALAERLGDPEALSHAEAARRRALWDPWHLTERLAASTEMLRWARRARNPELNLQAHAWLVLDLLEGGDREAVDAQIEAFTNGARQLRDPLYLWQAGVWRTMSALLDGNLQRAEELAAEALASGAPAEGVTAPQYYGIQLLAIRREQGRMSELEQAVRQMVTGSPGRPGWRAAYATMLLESDRTAEARAEFDTLAAGDFEDVPRDGDWLATMSLLGDLTVGLGDTARAGILYDAVHSCAGATVVAGIGAVCLGSAARTVGKLAAMLGHEPDAAELFERALEVNRALRAPAMLAHTQLDYAAALGDPIRAERLVEEASEAAERLGLGSVAKRAAQFQMH